MKQVSLPVRICLVSMAFCTIAPVALAQMPGAPVLQNAWAAPGVVLALDVAGGKGSLFGGAIGWAPSSGRFQLSGGAGVHNPTDGDSRGVYGARVAVPFVQLMGSKLGIAGFVGVGGGGTSGGDTTSSKTVVPLGVAVGYRQAIGTSGKGFSAYLDPNYQFHSGSAGNKGYFRIGGGVDLGLTARFGITLGFESGANAAAGEVGPRSGLYGVGVSLKLGR